MTTRFDRAKCVEFVDEINGPDLAKIWISLVEPNYNVFHRQDLHRVLEKYDEMSLWERQAVLYMLAPLVEQFTVKRAHKLSQKARREEPIGG